MTVINWDDAKAAAKLDLLFWPMEFTLAKDIPDALSWPSATGGEQLKALSIVATDSEDLEKSCCVLLKRDYYFGLGTLQHNIWLIKFS